MGEVVGTEEDFMEDTMEGTEVGNTVVFVEDTGAEVYPYYWGLWGLPLMGWPYASFGYDAYGYGWPYYSPEVTEAPPAYSEPQRQQQPHYWYYCQESQGYYPYVKSCPGGWMTVVPNVTPPNQ
jgi:hypothetical protein